jgi:1-acyl-sn-glycerol-3-phosphate acyltransferase
MFRSLVWFIYFWLYQVSAIFRLKKVDRLLAENKIEERDALVAPEIQRWALNLLKVAGCKVTVVGQENLILDRPVLYVSNHQGNFDIPILLGHLPGSKGFIAKDSIEKMPLVNRWMKHSHCVFMNRDNLRQSAAAINEGIRYIKAGYSMVIFPEGTRSLDGHLLEFKPGALKLGTKAVAPIVPVTISGSINMMQKGSLAIRPSKIVVTVHPAILPEGYAEMDTTALAELVKSKIESSL